MAFVSEYIPQADKKKHNMTSENHFYLAGANSWTVDRERDIFLLRRTGPRPESTPGEIEWAFYWHGHLMSFLIYTVDNGGDEISGHGWTHKKILQISGLTGETEPHRSEIIKDFKAGLTADKGLGIYSEWKTYHVTLDVE